MNKNLFSFFFFVLFTTLAFCAGNTEEAEKLRLYLNTEDAPIFYNNNPLTGMKSFTVIASFPLKDAELRKRIQQSIEKALEGVGEVAHLKDNDMRGFGAGNVLLIQMGNVTGWDGSGMPVSRISLCIETSVTLDKTGVKTFPIVWSINTFLQESVNSSSEDQLIGALQKLIGDFVQDYQYANREEAKRPVFYTYD